MKASGRDRVMSAVRQAEDNLRDSRAAKARLRDLANEMGIDQRAKEALLAHCRWATAADYAAWLDGYLRDGGLITHTYDYLLPPGWHVLESRPRTVPALHGAFAVHVIVPTHVDFKPSELPSDIGHNSFYFHVGPQQVSGIGWVPVYLDVLDYLRRGNY